tara:strand:- start:1294 stop:1578 length:285 start_codon:yes stop_codon:yes gene_type:complete
MPTLLPSLNEIKLMEKINELKKENTKLTNRIKELTPEEKDIVEEYITIDKNKAYSCSLIELEEKGNRLHEEYLTLTPEQQENWDLHGPNKPWLY